MRHHAHHHAHWEARFAAKLARFQMQEPRGGAFGGKVASQVGAVARRLADEHGRIVRVLLAREDVVRLGPKRPPLAAGIDLNGRGVVRVARTPGIAAAIAAVAPALLVEEVEIDGPPTSSAVRASRTHRNSRRITKS